MSMRKANSFFKAFFHFNVPYKLLLNQGPVNSSDNVNLVFRISQPDNKYL